MPIFQLTTSQGGRRVPILQAVCRICAFQLTTSQGGRHVRDHCHAGRHFLSTHDLTRRSTSSAAKNRIAFIFQLTTSQGGRLLFRGFIRRRAESFNSRPHKEVDGLCIVRPYLMTAFNSRPHKEVDGRCRCTMMPEKVLSTHDLTRRSTRQFPEDG